VCILKLRENTLFQLEEMVQLLIKIVGKTNKKMAEMDQRIKEIEQTIQRHNV